jgi:sn-glycerol 3-phosphate transport system ATP-binding protein
MSGIEVVGLAKHWDAVKAVDDISFEVAPGTLTVLLGPSGCGKSTTLRLIAGLDTVSAGQIRIGARDVTDAPPAERGLSLVFQSYALFPHLSVRENILFGLKVRRVPAADRERRLAKAADLLGLGALLGRKPSQLSGGQQQRVALGRAIVAEAEVCLMDEPLSNLDAQLRHEMRKEIRAVQQALGMTMVYVTHDQIEAMSLADQVVLMRGGRIEQTAVPSEMYGRPATSFAAGFIGTPPMSLLRLVPGRDGAAVAGATDFAVAPGEAAGALLGVRPEEVSPTDGAGLPTRVLDAEFLGAETVVTCAVGDGGERVQARIPGNHPLRPGTTLHLRLPQAIHLFDAADGRRLPDAP